MEFPMIHEFSRTELLLGTETMENLYSSTVAIFGIGGVGSHCTEALARCGIGRLILIEDVYKRQVKNRSTKDTTTNTTSCT